MLYYFEVETKCKFTWHLHMFILLQVEIIMICQIIRLTQMWPKSYFTVLRISHSLDFVAIILNELQIFCGSKYVIYHSCSLYDNI